MIAKTNYIKIIYSGDEEYNKDLITYIKDHENEITSFFGIDEIHEKVILRIWDNKDDFYQVVSKTFKKVSPWLCGVSHISDGKDYIDVLSLEELAKNKYHKNANIEYLEKLIIHEFVHFCIKTINSSFSCTWLNEGLATVLSGQCSNTTGFDASLDELLNANTNYKNYAIITRYIIDKYGRDYVVGLIRNGKKINTKEIYDEFKRNS